MITTYYAISYSGFNFHRKSTSCQQYMALQSPNNQAESRIDEEKLQFLSRFQINLLLFRALYGKYFLKINLTSKDQIAIV